MSKTNDTSNTATFEHHNTLADSALDAVTGNLVVYPIIGILIGQLNSKIEPVDPKPAPEKHWFNGG